MYGHRIESRIPAALNARKVASHREYHRTVEVHKLNAITVKSVEMPYVVPRVDPHELLPDDSSGPAETFA